MAKNLSPLFFRYLVISTLILFPQAYLIAQDKTASTFYTEKFDVNNPMEVDLVFNVKGFIKNKETEDISDALIRYTLDDGTEVEKKVTVKARGNYRRNKCYLPPIKINFVDEDYQVEAFNGLGNVKMVSICKVAGNYDQYLIKEYLMYKSYEYISEYSLNTLFLKVNFIDSEGKKKPFTGHAFLIEDIDKLAKRKDAKEMERNGLLPVHLYRPVMNPLAVFEYMTGNTDWHVPNLHNIKLLALKDPSMPQPIPVPYDFDYSGYVNTNYAVPHESLPIENIRERYFMGACMTKPEYEDVVEIFNNSKEEIYRLIEECNYLQKFNKSSTIDYLDDFYTIINDDKLSQKAFFSKCK